ncbi:HAD-IB family hydrolase [Vaginella massiliensis]|uniref:HAD-IB family hydrolase n=1 Tax=Vaginella massiliensis TaxID=1816680 RepID=UPI0008397840|nr:HAD-IB family hydrolase [Vaginella massiliensis]
MQRQLHLFDFDGTLTKVDTLFDFLHFSFPDSYRAVYLCFVPQFVLAKLKLKDSSKVKEAFIARFLKGYSKAEISLLAKRYFQENKDKILRPKAVDFLQAINNYHDKYIVSASTDLWLEPFAEYFGCGLICTQAAFNDNGIFTGSFATPNCNYEEKARRIQNEIDLKMYDEILAYGDTSGDKAMFELAQKQYFKSFNE